MFGAVEAEPYRHVPGGAGGSSSACELSLAWSAFWNAGGTHTGGSAVRGLLQDDGSYCL